MVQGLMETGWGYPGLWLVCAGSGLFIPMPEDVPLMYAGIQIHSDAWSWPGALTAAWLGVMARDLSAWAVGRYLFGWMLETGWFEWLVNRNKVERAGQLIRRHGASAVLMGRFMIGFRVPFFLAAGAMGVPLRAFVAYDALGLMIAVPLALGLGFLFGDPIAEWTAFLLHRSGTLVSVAAVIAAVWWTIRMLAARRSERTPLYSDVPAVETEDDP